MGTEAGTSRPTSWNPKLFDPVSEDAETPYDKTDNRDPTRSSNAARSPPNRKNPTPPDANQVLRPGCDKFFLLYLNLAEPRRTLTKICPVVRECSCRGRTPDPTQSPTLNPS